MWTSPRISTPSLDARRLATSPLVAMLLCLGVTGCPTGGGGGGGDDDPGDTSGGTTSGPGGSGEVGGDDTTTGGDPGGESTDTGSDTGGGEAFDCASVMSEGSLTPVDQTPACAPVVLTNASFEMPVISPPWERIDSDGANDALPGWVGNVDVHHSSDLQVAPDGGVQTVDLNQNGPGSVEQAVTLQVGAHYRLDFFHGINHHCVSTAVVSVEIGGTERRFTSTASGEYSSLFFTANEQDSVVRFTSLTPGCGAATIDDVSIECVDIGPTTVFGQPNERETVPNAVTGGHVFHPQGAYVDRSATPNRLYVWDSGNGRILGFASLGQCDGSGDDCTHDGECGGGSCVVDEGRSADLVFGQPDMSSATCNGDNTRRMSAADDTLCGQYYPNAVSLLESADPNSMAVDEDGNLFVVDKWNQRVLRYDDPFGTCDTVADFVYGQADFGARACNRGLGAPSDDTLCINDETGNSLSGDLLGSGVDAGGGSLWVTDGANHRVLRFPEGSSTADLVIGQPDFGSRSSASCVSAPGDLDPSLLCRPKALRYDAAADRLYVVDWPHAVGLFRVHVYDGPLSDGMAPTDVIVGTPDGASGEHWNRPNGIELDPTDADAFWLVDANNSRLLRYSLAGGSWSADKVISQPNLTQTGAVNVNCPSGTNSDCLVDLPGGSLGFDDAGNLYVTDLSLQRVMRFPAGVPAAAGLGGAAYPSDAMVLGAQPDVQLSRPINRVTGDELLVPNDVHVVEYADGSPSQMFVTDQFRVLVWNDHTSRATGDPADVVLVQDDFDTMLNTTGRVLLGLDSDSSGRVFVGMGDEVYVYQGPVATGAGPIAVVPADLPLATGGSITTGGITGLAYDESQDVLWIADTANHRVVRISQPTSAASRVVELVLGQPSLASTEANRGNDVTADQSCPTVMADGFGNLGKVALDSQGNLYVVDGTHEGWQCSNNRIVEYDAATLVPDAATVFFPDGVREASRVYGPDSLTEKGGHADSNRLHTPIGIAFDEEDHMVVTADAYGNPDQRVFLYFDPVPPCGTCSVRADSMLPITVSQASSAAWDSAGNLLVLDQTWARILLLSAADVAGFLPPP